MADDTEYDPNSSFADEDGWLLFLDRAFRKDSDGVHTFALLLFKIKKAIENDSDLGRATNILSDGIRLTYLYTEEHKLAFRLYMLHLTGRLKPQDEPRNLLNGAIERGIAEIKRTH